MLLLYSTVLTEICVLRSCLTLIPIKGGCSADLILSVKSPIVLLPLIPPFHQGFWSLVCGWKPQRGWWSGLQETSGPIPGLCEVWESSGAALSPRNCYTAFLVWRGAGLPPDPWELRGGEQSTAGQEQGEHPTTNNCSSWKCRATVNGT